MESKVALFTDVLSRTLTLEVQSALESCLDCGACGMACAWYLETGDRDLHPKRRRDFLRRVYRRCMTVEGRSLCALGVYKGPTEAELREQQEAFWPWLLATSGDTIEP